MQAFISAVAHLPTSDTCAGWLITKRTAMYCSCRSNVLATFVASIWKHTVREELHGRGDACGFATNPVTFLQVMRKPSPFGMEISVSTNPFFSHPLNPGVSSEIPIRPQSLVFFPQLLDGFAFFPNRE